jgi:hypothetical protein
MMSVWRVWLLWRRLRGQAVRGVVVGCPQCAGRVRPRGRPSVHRRSACRPKISSLTRAFLRLVAAPPCCVVQQQQGSAAATSLYMEPRTRNWPPQAMNRSEASNTVTRSAHQVPGKLEAAILYRVLALKQRDDISWQCAYQGGISIRRLSRFPWPAFEVPQETVAMRSGQCGLPSRLRAAGSDWQPPLSALVAATAVSVLASDAACSSVPNASSRPWSQQP